MNERITKKLTKKYIPTKQAIIIAFSLSLSIASLLLFFVDANISQPFFGKLWFNLYRIGLMTATVILILISTKQFWLTDKKSLGKDLLAKDNKLCKTYRFLTYAIPVFAVSISILALFAPGVASDLIRREEWPFYRNGIFIKFALEIASLIIFRIIAKKYYRQKNYLAMILAGFITLVLLVMAGEELSWGQRVFNWDTPSFIAEHNEQFETNLHNMATQAFQNVLYFGGWTLLIVIGFWRASLAKLINKCSKINFLTDWLTPACFVTTFALAFTFFDSINSEVGIYHGSNLFIVVATFIILIAEIIKQIKLKNQSRLLYTLIIAILFIALAIFNLGFNAIGYFNDGSISEYLEVMINIGILIWAITINYRLKDNQPRLTKAKVKGNQIKSTK